MSQPGESDDKQFEPTQKKLDDARRKGDVPRSADLNAAAAYGGFSIAAASVGPDLLSGLATELSSVLENAHTLSFDLFEGGFHVVLGGLIGRTVVYLTPWVAIPAVLVIVSIITQRSFVVAPTKLNPKLSRISIIANAKNKFGRQGLFEFLKSFVKLMVFSVILGFFLFGRTPGIVTALNLAPGAVTMVMAGLALRFIEIVLVVSLFVGLLDFLWQKSEHIRKNRMSRKEITDEAKQTEGDPQLKQQRRQKAIDIALNKMLADVPSADVIIVNPTHFAVALRWDRTQAEAPICVAKGVDEIAARIREISQASGVPIFRDPATARALFATIDIGSPIEAVHYRAVAAAIRFSEKMSAKARQQRNLM